MTKKGHIHKGGDALCQKEKQKNFYVLMTCVTQNITTCRLFLMIYMPEVLQEKLSLI